MIRTAEVVVERISVRRGAGEPLGELAESAVRGLGAAAEQVGGVVSATFSNPDRFPSLAVRMAGMLSLPRDVPAFDIQMACSAYPYALYVAGRLAVDTGRRILLVDGDVHSPLVDPADRATSGIFADAATATIVSASAGGESVFEFLTRYDPAALSCPSAGPIRMDGFGVFSFVATEVAPFLSSFIARSGCTPDIFAPHLANPYIVRQLSRSLGLSDRLIPPDEGEKNPGSCSVAVSLAKGGRPGKALVAGFGAGYSACAGMVRISGGFEGTCR